MILFKLLPSRSKTITAEQQIVSCILILKLKQLVLLDIYTLGIKISFNFPEIKPIDLNHESIQMKMPIHTPSHREIKSKIFLYFCDLYYIFMHCTCLINLEQRFLDSHNFVLDSVQN